VIGRINQELKILRGDKMGNLNKRVDNIENALKPDGDNFSFLQRLTDDELDSAIKSNLEELSVSYGVPLNELEAITNGPGMPEEIVDRLFERCGA
jgi:hypothetical protein